jgi:HPt (histidine-containing phosphotransfer) domain-containing protein
MEQNLDDGLIDWPALLERYQQRRDFVFKLLQSMRDSQRQTPTNLQRAIRQRDWDSLHFIAHSLKGLCGNLEAGTMRDLARRTQQAACAHEAEALELALQLHGQLQRLLSELDRFLGSSDQR